MKKYLVGLLMVMLLTILPTLSFQQAYSLRTTNLVWNANSEGDLAGYRMYRGINSCADASLVFLSVIVRPAVTYLDNKIPAGTNSVCYAVTAYDTSANESPFSNKVSKTINLAPSAPTMPSFK